ncbi:MAG: PDZ domain-containing protein [Phycisphaerales bacterium]|nr:PDZ domain-containing protein [Phycisphaerales bacterium]
MRRWAFALVPLAACGPAALGQDAPRPRGPALPPLAQYVPDDAGLFVEIDGLLDNSLLLREQHIWPVIERLLGAEDPDGGWPAALATNLGADSTASMVQLFRQRVALAAPNWQNLGEGIIVFTNASPRAMSAFFRRAGSDPVETRGQVRLYRSRGGMWIANLGPTVVLGRARGPQTMFDRATALLAEPGAKSLVAAESFRTCLADLQGPHLIWAYWSTPGPSAEAGGGLTDWWPALRQGALAVRARDNTLQIALRGLRDADAETPYQPRVRLERLLTLPQLTLAAWATSIDARELYTAARAADPPREYAHLWRLLTEQVDGDTFADQVIAKVGPRCIVCFSANFRSQKLEPQLALLIESVDAPAVVAALQEHAQRLAESASADANFQVDVEDYTGVAVHTLTWPRGESGDTLAALMAQGVAPAAAALDGWVVLATSRDQIFDIIDARSGLVQRLAEVMPQDWGTLRQAGSVAVLQPILAESMVRYWGSALEQRQAERQSRTRLGVQVETDPSPGVVVVTSVDSNGPAANLLAPGDQIVGCDHQLLHMSGALPHLRTLVAAADGHQPVMLRVLRDGVMQEVALVLPPVENPPPQGLASLFSQLGPVEGLTQSIPCAVLAVERPSTKGYRAQLMLTVQTPQTQAPPVPPSEIPPE